MFVWIFRQHHVCTEFEWIAEKSSLLFCNHNFWNFIERILNITCLGIIEDLYSWYHNFIFVHWNVRNLLMTPTRIYSSKFYPIKPHIFPQQFDVPIKYCLLQYIKQIFIEFPLIWFVIKFHQITFSQQIRNVMRVSIQFLSFILVYFFSLFSLIKHLAIHSIWST